MLRQFLFEGNYLLTIFGGSLVIKTRILMLILHVRQYSLQCWRSGPFFHQFLAPATLKRPGSWEHFYNFCYQPLFRLPLKRPSTGYGSLYNCPSPVSWELFFCYQPLLPLKKPECRLSSTDSLFILLFNLVFLYTQILCFTNK